MDVDQFDIFTQPKDILSVTQFNTLIKDVVKSLGTFKVKGEITEFRISPNKGLYMTMSDGKSNVQIGGYAPAVSGLDLIEKDMQVIIEGTADLYVPYGKFSLNAISIEPVGEGALAVAYQKLKDKLEQEGLFAEGHKQALPQYITEIVLITGKDSAAYSDFIKILNENSVGIKVHYIPALVQGSKSVESIQNALRIAQESTADIIVLTRGGGSLEDLKSFNDEELARMVFTSPKPIIAGVGHERDESICDFVADIRASTPSQAAYYIATQNKEFIQTVDKRGTTISDILLSNISDEERTAENNFSFIINYLLKQLEPLKQKVTGSQQLIETHLNQIIVSISQKVEMYERALKALDTHAILKRGFALVQKDGKGISSVKEIKNNDRIDTLLFDGKINSTVKDITPYNT